MKNEKDLLKKLIELYEKQENIKVKFKIIRKEEKTKCKQELVEEK